MSKGKETSKKSNSSFMIRPTFTIKKRACAFCEDKEKKIDYKDVSTLKRYTSDVGKIIGRRKTGLCGKHQRAIAKAIKYSRHMALLPYAVQVKP